MNNCLDRERKRGKKRKRILTRTYNTYYYVERVQTTQTSIIVTIRPSTPIKRKSIKLTRYSANLQTTTSEIAPHN